MGLSISDKLKKYITENGGDPSGAQTIAELVDKLPASGGSDEAFIVTFVEDGEGNISADKTHSEILEAFTNGKRILGMFDYSYEPEQFLSYNLQPLADIDSERAVFVRFATNVTNDKNYFTVATVYIESSGEINLISEWYNLTSLKEE